jgi:hypothetical protein
MNTQQTAKIAEPATDEPRASTPAELTASEHGAGKDATSSSPTLLMVNADDAAVCTADGCTVTRGKG